MDNKKEKIVCVHVTLISDCKIYRGFDDVVVDTTNEMTDELSLTGASKC
jgi:hypothetical protein